MSLSQPFQEITQWEKLKAQGRVLPNGVLALKKLTGRHYTVINYHLAGIAGEEIAKKMGMAPATITKILNDPLSVTVIKQRFLDMDAELRALLPKAITVLREGMEASDATTAAPDHAIRLSAADKFFRSQGYYQPKTLADEKPTAEDVVRKMLQMADEHGKAKITISAERGSEEPSPIIEGYQYASS